MYFMLAKDVKIKKDTSTDKQKDNKADREDRWVDGMTDTL